VMKMCIDPNLALRAPRNDVHYGVICYKAMSYKAMPPSTRCG
jgi:hypothetical protein